MPVFVGATVAVPLAGCVPVNAPPIVLDVVAVQLVALVDVHASCTVRPKVTVVACAGAVNVTVAAGAGVGAGIGGVL